MSSEQAAPAPAQPATPARCWECEADTGAALICPRCGMIQPFPEGTDYFSALGLPCSPVLDRQTLDQRYYELSRQLHPDRHQTQSPGAQAASAANTALLNRAYRTLRDPVERGRYWLERDGGGSGTRQTAVPANLAAIVFEVQEELEQLRHASPSQRPARAHEMAAIRRRIEQADASAVSQLEQHFTRWQEAGDPGALRTTLARILAEIAYLRALLRDIDAVLDG